MIATVGRNILKQGRLCGRGLSANGLLLQALKGKSSTGSSIRFLSSVPGNQPAHIALAEILSSEILHEQGEIEVDEDYEEIKTLITKSFKITDTPGYGSVTLERTYKGEQIVVTFDCQDVTEDVQDESQFHDFENQAESQIEQPQDEDEFESPPNRFGINFEVAITKKKAKTIFYCSSVEDRVVIQNVTFVPEGLEEAKAYSGPKYEDLDPAVRDGFQNYLAERKIDEDFAFYILSEARNKEEREYRNWLANLVEFYSK
jgi:hypothetical protein